MTGSSFSVSLLFRGCNNQHYFLPVSVTYDAVVYIAGTNINMPSFYGREGKLH